MPGLLGDQPHGQDGHDDQEEKRDVAQEIGILRIGLHQVEECKEETGDQEKAAHEDISGGGQEIGPELFFEYGKHLTIPPVQGFAARRYPP